MGVGEELTPPHRTQWTEWWSSLLLTSLPQPSQHPPQSGDGPGPRETNSPRDCQQQRTPAHAEHQRRFPVPQNTPAPHGRRETQQGAKKTTTCKHWHIEEDWFEFHFCFSNSFVRTSSYLSVHYSHFFFLFPSGGHLAADSGLHLRLGAGKDTTPGTEQPAETLHPGNSLCHVLHQNCVKPSLYSYCMHYIANNTFLKSTVSSCIVSLH